MFAFAKRTLTALARASVLSVLLAATGLTGCGAPNLTPSTTGTTYTDFQKAAILNAVDVALTQGDCMTAVNTIAPLYNSNSTDNDVRFRAASAYACQGKVNFFSNSMSLIGLSNSVASAASMGFFWRAMAVTYFSTTGSDYVVEGAMNSIDALESILNPGVLILPQYEVNAGTNNVGSVFYTDRTGISNLSMLYSSLSVIGGVEARYGSANATTGAPGAALSWTSATSFASANGGYGCGLASAMTDFNDSLLSLSTTAPAMMQSAITTFSSKFQLAFDYACDAGCRGLDLTPANVAAHPALATWVTNTGGLSANMNTITGCALTQAQCQPNGKPQCPSTLRNRTSCTGMATDVNSCAAAGLVYFLANSPFLGWN